MVSILPGQSKWDLIGQSIGQNLSNTLPGAVQQGYQRQQGLNAIDQLQADLKNSNGDYTKMASALMKAYTLNPGLERSGIGQTLLNQAIQGQVPDAVKQADKILESNQTNVGNVANTGNLGNTLPSSIGARAPSNPNQPTEVRTLQNIESPKEIKTAKDIDNLANQYIADLRPDLIDPQSQFGAISTFDAEVKQDLTPKEEADIREQLNSKGKNQNVIQQTVDRIREGIKNKFNELQSKYGFDKEKQLQIQQKWKTFTEATPERLQPHLEKYDGNAQGKIGFPKTKENLTNKYYQYAGSLPTNLTPQQMHTEAMAKLQNDIDRLDALHALPSMPPIHNEKDVKQYIDQNKPAYKDLQKEGFVDALKEDAILNKDMGNEEFHQMLWGDQTNKSILNDLHSLKAPEEYTKSTYANFKNPSPNKKYNKNYPEQHQKYILDLSERLRKLGKDDDLVLARAMVLDSGGTISDFNNALMHAEQNGLQLSPFQRSQKQEINIPRKPAMWEYFKEFTRSPSDTWAPLINYIRGKR